MKFLVSISLIALCLSCAHRPPTGHRTGDATAPPAAPSAAERPWLVYQRSGGFTGWQVRVELDKLGALKVTGTRQGEAGAVRAPLDVEALSALRKQVDAALARPPATKDPAVKFMADGQHRSLQVLGQGAPVTLRLSDGLLLGPEDFALVRLLEGLTQAAPKASP